MVSTCENHDTQQQTSFMQLMHGNKRNTDPLLHFTDPRYVSSQLMNEKYRGG